MNVAQLELIQAERTYGKVSRVDNGWIVADVPPHVAIRLKQVFPQIPKAKAEWYRITGGDDVAEDLLWFMVRYPMQIGPAVMADLRERKKRRKTEIAEADRIMLPDWTPGRSTAFNDGYAPYLYQAQAAALALRTGRLLVGDDVGLGKTVSALAAIVDGPKPAAVVCQAHLSEQWQEFVEEFTGLSVHVIDKTRPYDLPEADVYVFRFSNIGGWTTVAEQGLFRTVVFDEMQELRHGLATQKGTASYYFCHHAEVRVGLTATPVYNYGSEIWQVIRFLDESALGSYDDFCREWCTGSRVNDPQALGAYLRDLNLVLRRTEADVGVQMPPVNTLTVDLPWSDEIAEATEDEARTLAMRILEGSFTQQGQAAREFDALMRRVTGLVKARPVAAYVRMLVEAGAPVLLAGWHRDVYDIWLEALSDLNPVMYTGTESSAAKRRARDAFVSGESDLLIISLRSGVGLDGLQRRGRIVAFGEIDWSPQIHRQVIGRLRRPGQEHQVDALYFLTEGGSDPVMVETNGIKASQARGIMDPFLEVEEVHSDDSRIKRLARQFLEGRRP